MEVEAKYFQCRTCSRTSTEKFSFLNESVHIDQSDSVMIFDAIKLIVPEIDVNSCSQSTTFSASKNLIELKLFRFQIDLILHLICFDCKNSVKLFYEFRLKILENERNWNKLCASNNIKQLDCCQKGNKETSQKIHCLVCDKKFISVDRLQLHQINKHFVCNDLNTFRPYQCDQCDKKYTTHGSLNVHKRTHSGKTQ